MAQPLKARLTAKNMRDKLRDTEENMLYVCLPSGVCLEWRIYNEW